jgi:hypothetical protein
MASSLPRTEVLGFKDVSGQGQPLEIVDLPIFLPWSPLFTAWGPSDAANVVSGNGFSTIYGAETFSAGSIFMSHQAAMLQKVLQTGALSLVRRMKPEDAATATIRIWIDLVPETLKEYERNPDGTFKRTNGALVEVDGDGVPGFRYRFLVDEPGEEGLRQGSPQTGGLTNEEGEPSTMYPLIDIDARFFGAKGSNFGIRLSAPNTNSTTPANAELVEDQNAFMYRLAILERVNANSTGQVLMNLNGNPFVEFALKQNVVDSKTNINYGHDKRVLSAFEDNDPDVFSGYGPLKSFHVYSNHLKTVLEMFYEAEAGYGLLPSTGETTDAAMYANLVNMIGCSDINGVPYYALQLEGPTSGGVLFGDSATHWLIGGKDGDVSPEAYDEAVANELNTFGEGEIAYSDRASYPMSAFIDTGFTLQTKLLMANIMAVRPDAWVLASTQDVMEPLNTLEEDSNIGASLRNALALVPESEFYNTGACRAVVMKHAGRYLDSEYTGILPFTVDFAAKIATYMGSARMVNGYAPDNGYYRVVSRFVEHNAKFRHIKPRNTDWQAGISSAEPFDHRGQVFFPGIQTVYHDNTSVLNSFFPMAICCHLNRLGELAWRMFTGDSRRTAGEYTTLVDRFLEDQIKDRYDGRADITPRSYYTPADTQRGYSWHTDIEGLFDGMKTVGVLTVVAGRRAGQETE